MRRAKKMCKWMIRLASLKAEENNQALHRPMVLVSALMTILMGRKTIARLIRMKA